MPTNFSQYPERMPAMNPRDTMPPPAKSEVCPVCGWYLAQGWVHQWKVADNWCHHAPAMDLGGSNNDDPLPNSPSDRKQIPLATGLLDYFPRALAAVANCSWVGNEQHHPGTPLHWDKSKSRDHDDCLMRHFMQRSETDSDGVHHRAKVAWRALAGLEEMLAGDE